LQFLAAWIGMWLGEHQARVIEYQRAENAALLERLGKRRLKSAGFRSRRARRLLVGDANDFRPGAPDERAHPVITGKRFCAVISSDTARSGLDQEGTVIVLRECTASFYLV
jgi:hypothetical protein